MKKTKNDHPKVLLKCLLCLFIFLIAVISGFSQNAGISASGTTPPNAAAGLDVDFNTKGLLIPRVVLVSLTSAAPLSAHVAGMIIYNLSPNVNVMPGFYFNDGTKWVAIVPKANTAGDMQYWNGTIWVAIPAGTPGQKLKVNALGLPVWAP